MLLYPSSEFTMCLKFTMFDGLESRIAICFRCLHFQPHGNCGVVLERTFRIIVTPYLLVSLLWNAIKRRLTRSAIHLQDSRYELLWWLMSTTVASWWIGSSCINGRKPGLITQPHEPFGFQQFAQEMRWHLVRTPEAGLISINQYGNALEARCEGLNFRSLQQLNVLSQDHVHDIPVHRILSFRVHSIPLHTTDRNLISRLALLAESLDEQCPFSGFVLYVDLGEPPFPTLFTSFSLRHLNQLPWIMSTSTGIVDEFRLLPPSERSERMSTTVSNFRGRMAKGNKVVLDRVLDLIEATDGDETLHLDMLASHMGRCDPTHMEYFPWKDGYTLFDGTEINSMDAYRAWYSGLDAVWSHPPTPDGLRDEEHKRTLLQFLTRLQRTVRENADRSWHGDALDSLELPAEYCGLLEHIRGIRYENWDKQMFVPDFNGIDLNSVETLALVPENLSIVAGGDSYHICAGWLVGNNDENSWITYALSRHNDKDEPWRWRIFVEANFPNPLVFNSLDGFLFWLSSADDWINWAGVREDITRLHRLCSSSREEITNHDNTLEGLENFSLG